LAQATTIQSTKGGLATVAHALAAGSTSSGIKKFDEEKQIVWGEVYAPDVPDSQGDFMTAVEIEKMAYNFVKSGRLNKVDVQHDNVEIGSIIVETFVARPGDPDFIEGAWVVGVHVPDPTVWQALKSGELNGFSMEADGKREVTDLLVKIPSSVSGETLAAGEGDHTHKFTVEFTEEGALIGGNTDRHVDGHFHQILKGTITEPAEDDGHIHRFSFVELILEEAGNA